VTPNPARGAQHAFFLISIAVWLACGFLSVAAAPLLEPVVLQTRLNQHNFGQQFFFLDDQQQVYVSGSTLQALGIKKTVWQAWEGVESFPLRVLAPALRYRFDEILIRLDIEADPTVFEPQRLIVQARPTAATHALTPAAPRSAFLNYRPTLTHTAGQTALLLPVEVGFKQGAWLAYSNFIYRPELGLQRYFTYLSWDRPAQLQRVMLGDLVPAVQKLSPSAVLSGLSVRRLFTLQADFSPYPQLDLHHLLPLPATVALSLNEEPLREWQVKPGELVFTDWLRNTGQGEVKLRITDVFGHEQEIIRPYLVSSALLAAGLHDYQYDAGWQRLAFGQTDLRWGNWVIAGRHRYGWSAQVTAGLGFEWLSDRQLFLPELTWVWGGRLHNTLNLAYLNQASGDAGGGSLYSTFQHRQFSVSLGVSRYTETYQADTDALRGRESAEFTWYPGKPWGSVALRYEQSRNWYQSSALQLFELSYQHSVSPDWQFLLNLRQTQGAETAWAGFASLSYRLGKKRRLRASTHFQAEQAQHKLSLSQSIERGSSTGYRLSLQQTPAQDWQAEGRWQAQGQYGSLDTIYTQQTASVTWAGAIAWLPGYGLSASRPIADSFALVETGKSQVPIQVGGRTLGVTGNDGRVLIPEISAFYENRIQIPLEVLPLNYTLSEPVQYLRPPSRSGSVLRFDLQRFTAVEGSLSRDDGTAVSASAIQLTLHDQIYRGEVGKAGYFYLENLPPGRYAGTVMDAKRPCVFYLTIVESDDVVQSLGQIPCTAPPS